eukprot:SAG11_NODE_2659_length_3120_cov_2.024164_1_plen_77_part_00
MLPVLVSVVPDTCIQVLVTYDYDQISKVQNYSHFTYHSNALRLRVWGWGCRRGPLPPPLAPTYFYRFYCPVAVQRL